MKTTMEALEGNRCKVTVTVESKEIDARIKKAYKDAAYKYNFPGFRKGKAPRPVIDNALGPEAIRAQVTDDVINDTYPQSFEDVNLYPVGQLEPDPENGLVERGKDYTYVYEIDTKPEFELNSYDPVEVALPQHAATEGEIADQLDALTEHYYHYDPAPANTKVKADSTVSLKVVATDDKGENLPYVSEESMQYTIGSGLYPASFDEELMGLKKGDTKQFAIDVPEEPTAYTAGLNGKTEKIHLDIEVLSLLKKIKPELTDEWVKDTFGFETAAELRERVIESIEQQKEDIIPRLKENNCLRVLCERLEGEPPEDMVTDNESEILKDFFKRLQDQAITFDAYLMQAGIDATQFREDIKRQATDMAKEDLALDAVARNLGIEITEDDVVAEFEKSGATDPKALYEEWKNGGRLYLVRAGLARQKALDHVVENAVVTEYGDDAGEDDVKFVTDRSASKEDSDKAAETE
ncbi:MAG: trigger factor [Eggerthellaceae bacterium]|nr:trigger factor [Eggerthellaceae bacterium]